MLSPHVLDDDLADALLISENLESQFSELGGVEGVEYVGEELLLLLPPGTADVFLDIFIWVNFIILDGRRIWLDGGFLSWLLAVRNLLLGHVTIEILVVGLDLDCILVLDLLRLFGERSGLRFGSRDSAW